MNYKRQLVILASVAAVALAIWLVAIRDGAPDAATSASAIAAIETNSSIANVDGIDAESTDSPGHSGTFDGSWTIDTADEPGEFPFTSDTYLGYRVVEELASIGGFTAVGRTTQVSGSLTIDGTQATAVTVEGNLLQLTSDTRARDEIIKSIGLESATFPTATFNLTEPIELGEVPAEDVTIMVDAVGDLTLHGVTNRITISLEATPVGDSTIVVVGTALIVFADYGIEPPEAAIVLSIEDEGEFELQLFFTRDS